MKKFFSVFLVSGLVFLFLAGAHVMPASALRLMPTVVEYAVAPGTSQTHTIALYNETDQEIHVVPTVYAVDSSDLNGFPHLVPIDSNAPSGHWFSFPKDQDPYILKAKETRRVEVTVSLPKSVQPGGYYFSLAWGLAKDGGAMPLSENPGINIAITVPGVVKQEGKISFFGFQGNSSFTSTPVHFIAHISNEGGLHFKPIGRVDIRNMFGILVDRVMLTSANGSLPQESGNASRTKLEHVNVLPGATRIFYATWKPSFAMGPYTATLSVDAEGAGKFSETRSFTIFPSALLGLCAGFMGVLFIAALYFLKKTLKHFS